MNEIAEKRTTIKDHTKVIQYLTAYSLIFLVLMYCCFFHWLRRYNKSIMCTNDSMNQHYLFFVYIGRWLRQCARIVFVEHSLSIPMFDMGIGYGGDILYSLSAHLADPFNWLSAIIPEYYTDKAYTLIIVLKLYLGGASFSFLGFRRRHSRRDVLIGTIVYVFSAYSYILILQPLFLNMLYIVPLVIAGADDLWNKKRSKMFLLAVFWAFANYFYFAYMTVVLLVLYCIGLLIRDRKYFCSGKRVLSQIMKYVLHSLCGVALAAPILVPVAVMMSGSQRVGADFYVPLLYSKEYYQNLLSGFSNSYMMMNRDCYIGFSMLALWCVGALFAEKGNRRLKTEVIFLSAGACIPLFGSILNGGGYSANRWIFAYVLLISYVVVKVIDSIQYLPPAKLVLITGILAVYLVLISKWNGVRNVFWIDIMGAAFLLFFVLSRRISGYSDSKGNVKFNRLRGSAQVNYVVLIGLTMGSVIIPARYRFSENFSNGLAANAVKGQEYENVTNAGALPLLREVSANSAERFDGYEMGNIHNETLLYGLSGMDLYLSNADSNIEEFHNNLALLTNAANTYYGLNRRSELQNLLGVTRFLITQGDEKCLPYGFDAHELTDESHGEIYSSYKNHQQVSLLHTFDSLLGESDYLKLTPYERQQALMQTMVVDDSESNVSLEDLFLDQDEVPYDSELINMERGQDGTYVCGEGGGSMLLTPDADGTIGKGECYIYLQNIDYECGEENSYSVRVYGIKDGQRTENTDRLRGTNNRNHIYEGRHNWLINIGYLNEDDSIDAIEICFESAGEYRIDGVQWFIRGENELSESIASLNNVDSEINIGVNRISAQVSFDREEHVLLSVPYIKGWRLLIDGQTCETYKADDAFIGFDVPAGEHEIELIYCTPGIKIGLLIAAGAVMTVLAQWKRNQMRRVA